MGRVGQVPTGRKSGEVQVAGSCAIIMDDDELGLDSSDLCEEEPT